MKKLMLAAALATLIPMFAPPVAMPAESETGMRAGPAVWIEEYWDVKPERLDEFFQ